MEREPLGEVVRAVGPQVLREAGTFGAAGGLLGLTVGGVFGTVRQTTPILFAVASGIQTSTLAFTWTATRKSYSIWFAWQLNKAADDLTKGQRQQVGAAAGATAFGTSAAIFRGRGNILPALFVGSLLGYLLPPGTSVFSRAETSPEDEQKSIGQWLADSRLNPMQKLSDEQYMTMLREKQVRNEADIALLDEQIAQLRAEDNAHNRSSSP